MLYKLLEALSEGEALCLIKPLTAEASFKCFVIVLLGQQKAPWFQICDQLRLCSAHAALVLLPLH